MSERTTGATDEQIEAAVPRFHAHFGTLDRFEINVPEATRNNSYMTIDEAAAFLVPPDHAIVGPAELKAIQWAVATIAAAHEVEGFDDWGKEGNFKDGICPLCDSGIEDASSYNAARNQAHLLLYEDRTYLADLSALIERTAVAS